MRIIIVLVILLISAPKMLAEVQASLSDAQINKIVNAIYIVEGGAKTKYPYGIKSIKTSDPRRVCANTVRNNFGRWVKAGAKGDFLEFLADRYCPPSVDPKGNANWRKNIKKLLGQ